MYLGSSESALIIFVHLAQQKASWEEEIQTTSREPRARGVAQSKCRPQLQKLGHCSRSFWAQPQQDTQP